MHRKWIEKLGQEQVILSDSILFQEVDINENAVFSCEGNNVRTVQCDGDTFPVPRHKEVKLQLAH